MAANDDVDSFTIGVSAERTALGAVLGRHGFRRGKKGWVPTRGYGTFAPEPMNLGRWHGLQASSSFRVHRESGEYLGMGESRSAIVSDGTITLTIGAGAMSGGMIETLLRHALPAAQPPN